MIAETVMTLVQEYAGKRHHVTRSTEIRRDLHIDGSAAEEMLMLLVSDHGVSFLGFNFSEHFYCDPLVFPARFCEALCALFGRRLTTTKSLTVGHLIDVAESGMWFDPPPPSHPAD